MTPKSPAPIDSAKVEDTGEPVASPISDQAAGGWKLVPIEPTPEMAKAGMDQWYKTFTQHDLYVAMVNAAPTAPTTGSAPVALQELENIVNAKRFDHEHFEDDTSFADWVQSRARACIALPMLSWPTSYGPTDWRDKPIAPMQGADGESLRPAAWAATSEAGKVEALGFNQSRRFDTPLFFATRDATPIDAYMEASQDIQGGEYARPVAITDVERKAIAKSVFGGINALRWILNITTEFDRKDVRTRQAARLLDGYCTGEGTTNRAHLEHLWKTLNDALSLEDTLECLATRDATPIVDADQVAFKGTMTVFGDGSRDYQFIEPSPNLKHGKYEVTCSIAASAREEI